MARTTKARNTAKVASKMRGSFVNTSRKPTHENRLLVSLISILEVHGRKYFPITLLHEQVEIDADKFDEPLGKRVASCINTAISVVIHNGYLKVDDLDDNVRISKKAAKMLASIKQQMSCRVFGTKTAEYRTFCDHIRQRTGRLTCLTKPQLVMELERRNKEMQRTESTLSVISEPEFVSPEEADESSSNPVGCFSEVEEMLKTVARPSPSTTNNHFVTPAKSTSLTDPRAVYPTPDSAPRHRGYAPHDNRPPISPTPGRQSFTLGDSGEMMDIDDPLPRSTATCNESYCIHEREALIQADDQKEEVERLRRDIFLLMAEKDTLNKDNEESRTRLKEIEAEKEYLMMQTEDLERKNSDLMDKLKAHKELLRKLTPDQKAIDADYERRTNLAKDAAGLLAEDDGFQ